MVVRDARDWSIEIARRDTSNDLDSVFSSIVKRNRQVIATVFVTYARQDAAAAIRLADHVGVNMLVDHPDLLVASCQEEPFVSLVLDKISSGAQEEWSAVLTEAALRFENVARRLNSATSPGSLTIEEMLGDRRIRWLLRLCRVRPRSWYGLLLRSAFMSSEGNADKSALSAIMTFKSCTKRVYLHRLMLVLIWLALPMAWLFFEILTAKLISLFYIFPSSEKSSALVGFLAILIVFGPIPPMFTAAVGFTRYIRNVYYALGNCTTLLKTTAIPPLMMSPGVALARVLMPVQTKAVALLTELGTETATAARSQVMSRRPVGSYYLYTAAKKP